MNNIKNILATLLMVLVSVSAFSQAKQFTVKGKVVDPYTNAPIEGAIVGATGLAISVNTDDKGEFSFEVPSLRGSINVWALGYFVAKMPISGRTNINVILVPEDKIRSAQSAQVPLQGNVSADDNVAKSSSIEKRDIEIDRTQIEQVFRDIPGLYVVDKSGMPGEGSYFDIRGTNSFNSKTAPLVVLDGVPMILDLNESPVITGYSRGALNSINPRDIQNITVLKGADAAIYGSMGSNGVIMIETDKAAELDTKIEFIGQYGVNMNQVRMPLLDIGQYKNYVNSVARTQFPTDGEAIKRNFPFLVTDPTDATVAFNNYLFNNNTDWQDLIYRPGFLTDNVLKIKGGDAIAKFDVSAGYLGNAGQVENTSFDKYYIRLNSNVNLSRRLSLTTTLSSAYMNSTLMEQGMSKETNPMLTAMSKSPMISPFMKDPDNTIRPVYSETGALNGTVGALNNQVSNPLSIINDIQAETKVYDINLNGGLIYKVNNEFTISNFFGILYNLNRESIFIPSKTIMPLNDGMATNTSRAGVSQTKDIYYAFNAGYAKTYNTVHDVKGSVGFQTVMNNSEYDAGKGMNSTSDFFRTLDNTSTVGRQFFGYNDTWNWMNFNARGQYIYNGLFGVGAVLASDRSSAIGNDAQLFELYPAVNGAVYLKNLPLINNISLINKLTVRADYTTTGNSQFATKLSKSSYSSSRYGDISSITRTGIPNTRLGAEITRTASLGLDLSLLDHRVDVSAEYYYAKSSNLIMQSPISSAFGNSFWYENLGKVSNEGFDVTVQLALIQRKDMRLTIGGTISRNKNKVLSLGKYDQIITELPDGSAVINKVGLPMNSFYGYVSGGVWQTNSQATASGLKNVNGQPFRGGDVRFADFNGDKVIGSDDRQVLGSANPKFFGTLFGNLRYKAFEASGVISYSYHNKAYNAVRRFMEASSDYRNQYKSVANRWTMDGQVTDMPRATYGDPMENNRFSDRYVEGASFIKLKELMVSYRLPMLNGVRVFAAGENLYTITHYLGADPELAYSYNSTLLGFDYAKIALARTVKFGVKVQF